jgi:hypothetical protein
MKKRDMACSTGMGDDTSQINRDIEITPFPPLGKAWKEQEK